MFGDFSAWLHVTMRKLTGRQSGAGQPRALPIVGRDRGWARDLLSLMILLEFVNSRPTPVVSRVGNRQRCVNIGNLSVLPPSSLLRASSDSSFLLPKDFQKSLETDAIQGVDVYHQLSRLRHGKNLPDAEAELMMRTFAENLQSYDQVVEVRSNRDDFQSISLTADC